MAAPNAWTTLSERTVYENAWIRVREDRFVRPDGETGIYGVIEIRPSVGVVAVNERREIALIGQYRYTSRRYTWEIPRGGSGPEEQDLLAVARRELREEAGVEAAAWELIGVVDVCNGVTTDVQHLFLARELTMVQAEPDPEEDLTVRWVPFAEAVRMAHANEITEVCSVAAILKAEALLRESEWWAFMGSN
jgi:8-oxo-dGTP pyrophosphatase MutT (NUDIX family)